MSHSILSYMVLVVLALTSACVASEGTYHVNRGVVELFVDDEIIDQQQDLKRTLHQPVKEHGGERPLIPARPGTTLLAYGSIVKDTRLRRWVMFVQEFPSRDMYRAISEDGINWEERGGNVLEPVKFDLDIGPIPPDVRGRFGIDLFSCYYDTADDQYPYKGWLYFANCGDQKEGIWYVYSADGADWKLGPQVVDGWAGPGDTSSQRIEQDGYVVYGAGDVTLFAHDPIENRFLGLFKFFTTEAVGPGNHLRSRAYAFVDALDEWFDVTSITRVALLPPAREEGGDLPFDEYYASSAWRYGSQWLGDLKVYHSQEDYPWSDAGCAFLKLLVSCDGLNWKKVPFENEQGHPEVFLANGPEGGNNLQNDGGYISQFSQGPLRIKDELIYYYSASSLGKNHPYERVIRGGGIFRSRLRPDGFVSIDAGTLTTRRLKFGGEDLLINSIGPVKVEVLDADQQVLASTMSPGGDSLRHRVRFNGKSLGQVVSGGFSRLRFSVQPPSRLFAFVIE